ncbi:hypothetical protein C343_06406 [Cryptococcus neoformans C23]|uniref:Uncharacterized protein n=2 Tax=Cryptococcus neoformans TaxID=5207 RepID=A0A854Q2N5_CRYNE|nr:hypothetical protein CNAG_06201 [Cryptococcus neoformans var. grubii H99]AUB28574.1 hypothetical protein CKF44_06201 [Cryptococcus neoformans var. grubii]OWZ28779.1 hypothetical protein C353_06429 [Cryptococcus neoformans var. grubii AD1-83a]OWZ39198.1 hypothetical protein C343_06406 [Cryptococcus neoformans var. grubii C23]OWZ50529.1 hypothetical protein C368_06672 [Cryptococcus neoformans var. grubii 125.91]OXC81488.1 hypothetical protein C344_06310 [Cryptococcus neoformans var. grubii AD|eukprot:XP_012053199.1 hypothetical protein CNAG_06201 [Cryptococcus neoformans var. grubii H99]
MPSELLHLPPLYAIVGLYRLATDPSIRTPVLDKVKHAAVRGVVVGSVYTVLSWKAMDWFIRKFLISGGWWKKGEEVLKDSVDGSVQVGLGKFSLNLNAVLYTHLLILLPQLSSILRFFIYKNLKIARSRAYALTVSSRGKPAEFWSQGYIEEWAQPPRVQTGELDKNGRRVRKNANWISWILWWPTQLVMRKYLLIPLSPSLPLLSPVVTSVLKSLTTAEYLHRPYFDMKGMSNDEIWRWVEERKWAYRAFGFATSLLESVPVIGLFFSISNRIGAAMWAFDLEKRQHLFANNIVQPLQPEQVGFYGMGRVDDLGVDIQKAEDELEKKWSQKQRAEDESEKLGSIRGSSLEPAVAGSKSDIFELHGGDDGSKQGQGNSFVT